jgi:hypothetical protein
MGAVLRAKQLADVDQLASTARQPARLYSLHPVWIEHHTLFLERKPACSYD